MGGGMERRGRGYGRRYLPLSLMHMKGRSVGKGELGELCTQVSTCFKSLI